MGNAGGTWAAAESLRVKERGTNKGKKKQIERTVFDTFQVVRYLVPEVDK